MNFTLIDLQPDAGHFGVSANQIAVDGVIAAWTELVSVLAIIEFAVALLMESMPTNIAN